jgi:hypothetical protein
MTEGHELHSQQDTFRGRFLALIIVIVLTLAVTPLLEDLVSIHILIDICFTAMFASAIYAVSHRRNMALLVAVAAVPLLALSWGTYIREALWMYLGETVIGSFIMAYLITVLLFFIGRAREVNRDVIQAAVVVYFLVAFLWVYLYRSVALLNPEAFNWSLAETSLADQRYTLVYFSFVTITTLGYGDISPASNMARSLSILEAVIGQLYIAIIIARLVGIQISQYLEQRSR